MSHDWDWAGAEREYKRAIELNPDYAAAHYWYALFVLKRMARFDEAIEEIKRALELDPLSLPINRDAGGVFYYARLFDQAIEALEKTIEMDPNFRGLHQSLGLVYLQKSMYEEALEEFQKEKEVLKTAEVNIFSGIAYARMGKRGKAQQMLESFKWELFQYWKALLSFSLGEKDQGFEFLDKAYEVRDSSMLNLKVDPLFDSVRSDPRFTALLKKMGLDE